MRQRALREQLWGAYFTVQAVACLLWWWSLRAVPGAREAFIPHGWRPETLESFWLADSVGMIGGSALCALGFFTSHRLLPQALWFTAGGVTFGTLYCVGVSFETQQAWLGVAMMTPAMMLTLWATREGQP